MTNLLVIDYQTLVKAWFKLGLTLVKHWVSKYKMPGDCRTGKFKRLDPGRWIQPPSSIRSEVSCDLRRNAQPLPSCEPSQPLFHLVTQFLVIT
jgi:hypothetical protein